MVFHAAPEIKALGISAGNYIASDIDYPCRGSALHRLAEDLSIDTRKYLS